MTTEIKQRHLSNAKEIIRMLALEAKNKASEELNELERSLRKGNVTGVM